MPSAEKVHELEDEVTDERQPIDSPVDADGGSMLLAASHKADFALAGPMLMQGANVNLKTRHGFTALMAAACSGKCAPNSITESMCAILLSSRNPLTGNNSHAMCMCV